MADANLLIPLKCNNTTFNVRQSQITASRLALLFNLQIETIRLVDSGIGEIVFQNADGTFDLPEFAHSFTVAGTQNCQSPIQNPVNLNPLQFPNNNPGVNFMGSPLMPTPPPIFRLGRGQKSIAGQLGFPRALSFIVAKNRKGRLVSTGDQVNVMITDTSSCNLTSISRLVMQSWNERNNVTELELWTTGLRIPDDAVTKTDEYWFGSSGREKNAKRWYAVIKVAADHSSSDEGDDEGFGVTKTNRKRAQSDEFSKKLSKKLKVISNGQKEMESQMKTVVTVQKPLTDLLNGLRTFFQCSICLNLMEEPNLCLACRCLVACGSCFTTWRAQNNRCPKCN